MLPTTPLRFDPERVESGLSAQRRRIVGAVLGAVGPLATAGLLILVVSAANGWRPPPGLVESALTVAGFASALSLLLVLVHALWHGRMTRQRVAPGLALQLSPLGIEAEGVRIRWDAVTAIRAEWSRSGQGHTLRVEHTGGPAVLLPLDALEVLPAGVDSAVRAYSGGRHSVDLTACGA